MSEQLLGGLGERQVEAGNGNGHHEPGPSLLDSLRARRAEAAAEHTYDLEVPGYEGCLVLRLAPLRGQEVSALARRAESSKAPDRDFNANADILIRACGEVLGREHREQPLRTVHPDGETPLALGSELAEMLGIEASTTRELLLALWQTVPSPELAIGLAAGTFMRWAAAADSEEAERFVGES